MPIVQTWNNVIDAAEIAATFPVSASDLERIGSPASACKWILEPSDELKSLDSPEIEPMMRLLTEAAYGRRVSIKKIVPEDVAFDSPRWYVEFGSMPRISRRLDLPQPDWEKIRRLLGFSASGLFVWLGEAWPGLTIGGIEKPAFLLPSTDWVRHECLSP